MNTETPDLATIPKRFIALAIDSILLCLVGGTAGYFLPYLGGAIVWFLYGPIFECSTLQATLGKYWMDIQVVDLQGKRISFRTAFVRNVVKLFSSVLLCLGYAIALFTQQKQALHDLAADTLVVVGRSEKPVADAWTDSIREISSKISWEPDRISKLERLQKLREQGALTEEEFQAEKRKL